jgi:uncharacterized membrane protein
MTKPNTARTANTLADAAPSDALKDAGQRLLGLLIQRAAQAATERVGDLSDRLTDVTENGGRGIGSVLTGGRDGKSDEDEDSRPSGRSRMGRLAEKVKNVFGGGKSGGQQKIKVTNIVESIDVGLPLRTTYDLWTQFADFPSFMKKVESVEQASDEKTNWKAQVFWSHRTWEATIREQVPDSHIVWRSKGPKGHVDGAVTFTEIGPNLTRVLLVLEYWPQGLFERTGNLWRAQGRRARLEFKHFRRYAMSRMLLRQEEIEGWRGEIRDSEVVKTHEDAIEEEQRARGEKSGEHEEDEEDERGAQDKDVDQGDQQEGQEGETEEEDRHREEEEDEEDEYGADDEAEEGEDDLDEYEDEEEDQSEEDDRYDEDEDQERASGDRRSRREPAAARSGKGR